MGRDPFVKLTATFQNTHPDAGGFPHLAECYLADASSAERGSLASGLTQVMSESLVKWGQATAPTAPGKKDVKRRTPELGSLRSVAVLEQPTLDAIAASLMTAPPGAKPAQVIAAALGAADGFAAGQAPQVGLRTGTDGMPVVQGPGAAPDNGPDLRPDTRFSPPFLAASEPPVRLIPTDEIADMVRPALTPWVEAAEELRDDMAQELRRRATRENIMQGVLAFALFIASIFLVYYVATLAAPSWNRSGSDYSDSLKKFSPRRGDSAPADEP